MPKKWSAGRELPDINGDACNRLTLENADFRDFISWVRQFQQPDNARVGDWDLPPTLE